MKAAIPLFGALMSQAQILVAGVGSAPNVEFPLRAYEARDFGF